MEIRKVRYRNSEVAFNQERGASLVTRCEPTPGVLCQTHRKLIASTPWDELVALWEFAREQDDGLAMAQCAFSDSEGRCGDFLVFCSRSSTIQSPYDLPLMPLFLDFEASSEGTLFGPVANETWCIIESKEDK